jgi:hypothetical protein
MGEADLETFWNELGPEDRRIGNRLLQLVRSNQSRGYRFVAIKTGQSRMCSQLICG